MRNGSTRSIALAVRRDELGQAAGRDAGAPGLELARGSRADDPVDLSGEAVDEAGLEAADGRLADHARRRDEVDLDEARGAGEERLHRDLDPRREYAADVFALRRDDVEVRRGAEVDDDRGRAVALLRGDGVDDPVGADLARVVVADRDPRLDARPDDEQRRMRPPLASRSHSRTSAGTVRREADPVDRLGVEQAAEQDAELVAGARALGREAPVLARRSSS